MNAGCFLAARVCARVFLLLGLVRGQERSRLARENLTLIADESCGGGRRPTLCLERVLSSLSPEIAVLREYQHACAWRVYDDR